MAPYTAVVLTSVVACLIAVKRLDVTATDLAVAFRRMVDALGTGVVFAVANVGVAAAMVLGVRTFTRGFLSIYTLDDPVWLIVSLLQGWLWRLWIETGASRVRARSDAQAVSLPRTPASEP